MLLPGAAFKTFVGIVEKLIVFANVLYLILNVNLCKKYPGDEVGVFPRPPRRWPRAVSWRGDARAGGSRRHRQAGSRLDILSEAGAGYVT